MVTADGIVIVLLSVDSHPALSLTYITYVPPAKLEYVTGKFTYVPPKPILAWYPAPLPPEPFETDIVPVPGPQLGFEAVIVADGADLLNVLLVDVTHPLVSLTYNVYEPVVNVLNVPLDW
jgi:hypothetical protein